MDEEEGLWIGNEDLVVESWVPCELRIVSSTRTDSDFFRLFI